MLLGTIVDHQGMICLQSATNPKVFYPLDGNSGIAADFQESFNKACPSDVGRTLHRVDGIIYMEVKK